MVKTIYILGLILSTWIAGVGEVASGSGRGRSNRGQAGSGSWRNGSRCEADSDSWRSESSRGVGGSGSLRRESRSQSDYGSWRSGSSEGEAGSASWRRGSGRGEAGSTSWRGGSGRGGAGYYSWRSASGTGGGGSYSWRRRRGRGEGGSGSGTRESRSESDIGSSKSGRRTGKAASAREEQFLLRPPPECIPKERDDSKFEHIILSVDWMPGVAAELSYGGRIRNEIEARWRLQYSIASHLTFENCFVKFDCRQININSHVFVNTLELPK